MKRASHKLGFIGTLSAIMGIASNNQKHIDSQEFKKEPSHDEIILRRFLDSPIFEPKRSTIIKNKRRKLHKNRVKAK